MLTVSKAPWGVALGAPWRSWGTTTGAGSGGGGGASVVGGSANGAGFFWILATVFALFGAGRGKAAFLGDFAKTDGLETLTIAFLGIALEVLEAGALSRIFAISDKNYSKRRMDVELCLRRGQVAGVAAMVSTT